MKQVSAALVAVLLAGLALVGCDSTARLTGRCGVALDGSGSGNAKTGFNAGADVKRDLSDFLIDEGCRYLAFAPISGNSPYSSCHADQVDLDPDSTGAVDRTALRAGRRGDAVKQAQQMLGCIRDSLARNGPDGSDVVGGLKVLTDNRPTAGSGAYHVLVVSDFAQYDQDTHFYLGSQRLDDPAVRKQIIDGWAKDDRLPDLKNATVTASGYQVLLHGTPHAKAGFTAFWQELMRRAGCTSFQTTFTGARH